jgi:glycosyltransferase involved in cell wall biosynthesis
VQNQTYKNIEHIVIDGASTDGTLDLLKEYQEKGWIKYYSEPDRGIYDALNKGIERANGKYVVCLNSDDFYCDNRAVEYLVKRAESVGADAVYGDAIRVRPDDLSVMHYWSGRETFYPLFSSCPCHQTFSSMTWQG